MTCRVIISFAVCLSAVTAMAQPSPSSWSGVPEQIIPQSAEVGAPAFTTPTGSSTFGGLNGVGSSGGGSVSGPTSGATAAIGNGSSVSYTNPDGSTSILTGGSAAWRDNNPGNLVYNDNTQALGAIGQNNGFAVFPDVSSGTAALTAILQTPTYQALSVNAAIARYAPSFENNTAAYQSFVTNTLGVSGTTLLNSLSQSQMQSLQGAIQTQEGYTPGTVTHA